MNAKLNLFCITLFDFFPRRVRRSSFLRNKLRRIANTLSKDVVVFINGVKYILVDLESLSVVSPEFESWMWNYLQPENGDNFIDVGAHVGKYALKVARMVGNTGLVVAVEPHPWNYRALLGGVRLNALRNVITLNIAAWKKTAPKSLVMFIGNEGGRHSLKKFEYSTSDYIRVHGRDLDGVFKELNVKSVDWIKVDVEGAEVEVLTGLRDTIRTKHPKIVVEVSNENLEAVFKLMKEARYTVSIIDESKYELGVYLYCEPRIQSNFLR